MASIHTYLVRSLSQRGAFQLQREKGPASYAPKSYTKSTIMSENTIHRANKSDEPLKGTHGDEKCINTVFI